MSLLQVLLELKSAEQVLAKLTESSNDDYLDDVPAFDMKHNTAIEMWMPPKKQIRLMKMQKEGRTIKCIAQAGVVAATKKADKLKHAGWVEYASNLDSDDDMAEIILYK